MTTPHEASANAVHAEGFSFAYAGQSSLILSKVTMDVPEGAFAVIRGSTGSGKTTLLKCMTGVLAPAGEKRGILDIFGCGEPAPFDVGYVMQDPESQIVCDTVLRELAFGLESMGMHPDAMRRRVAEVATVFGIGSLVDAKTADLSGGQKQLVNLAAALAMRPRLLLLDEPTAQLDPVSARHLCDALRVVNAELGVTVVVATHSPELFSGLATCAFDLEGGTLSEMDVACLSFEQGKGSVMVGPHPEEGRGPSGSSDRSISVQGAWFAYARDDAWVLRGLEASFGPGAISGIVGGNGCGKTTLLKAIAGIVKPQRGKVRNPLQGFQAYLPQDPRLLFTAETVEGELARIGSIPAGFLESLSADELALSPLDLSGGQQQMLALGMLLSTKPKLLLLDEPVKGLDAAWQMRLATLLRQLAEQGATVILATHDISFVSRVADAIALMFDGQVASSAPPSEFFADAAYYKPKANAFTVAWDASHAPDSDAKRHG